MKECANCGAEFAPTRSWQVYCSPKCQHNNPKKSATTRAYQQRRRAKLDLIKMGSGCADCGYDRHPEALDFHHTGDKKFSVSQDVKRAWSSMMEEIAKCEVLCANCHRIRTYQERCGTCLA